VAGRQPTLGSPGSIDFLRAFWVLFRRFSVRASILVTDTSHNVSILHAMRTSRPPGSIRAPPHETDQASHKWLARVICSSGGPLCPPPAKCIVVSSICAAIGTGGVLGAFPDCRIGDAMCSQKMNNSHDACFAARLAAWSKSEIRVCSHAEMEWNELDDW